MRHISESAVLLENDLTLPKLVDIYLLLLCCCFVVSVRESFYKKLLVRPCKRLGTAVLDDTTCDLKHFKPGIPVLGIFLKILGFWL